MAVTASAVLWGLLAVLMFWAIGAYNRLMRLRGRSSAAFAVVDERFSQQVRLLPALSIDPHPWQAVAAAVSGDAATVNRWSGLVGAGRQLEASLKAVRVRPLDADGLHALRTAYETLVSTWVRCRDEPPDLAGASLPEDLTAKWDQLMVQTDIARTDFNRLVVDYNAAIDQMPACLLAWLFGFRPAQSL